MFSTIPATTEIERAIMHKHEDHFCDFKSCRIQPNKLQQHFVGFANADGGELYVGIEDESSKSDRIIGFARQEDANEIISVLLMETRPSVEGVDVEFLDFGSRGLVLQITIPKSAKVHYASDGECYVRLNAQTTRIKGERILQLGYAKGSESYESRLVLDTPIEDILSSYHLQRYLDRIGSNLEPLTFLRKQRLIREENGDYKPTVACVLLFDEEPQAALNTRCAIKVYRLQTDKTDYKREYLHNQPTTIEGPIESQIYAVIQKLNELLSDVSVNREKVKLRYPQEALKELLVNAVIHRDYSLNDDIHVRVYDNRIEVRSPGKLPGYITLENIYEERFSRNPVIVRALHRLPDPVNKDIGEGLDTVRNALRSAKLVEPLIEELENSVQITVEHRSIESLRDIILRHLENNPVITNRDVREISGEDSENKVKREFQRLREEGLIEPIDPSASAFDFQYQLTKPK